MLRVYFLAQWFNLSDPAVEEALYDMLSMRAFARIDLGGIVPSPTWRDSRSKLVHSIVATAANVHDGAVLADLLHGEETRVYGDCAYLGKGDVIREKSPRARAFINKRAYRSHPLTDQDRETNRRKSSVRARAEHIFGTVKGYFGVLFALSNLFMVKKRLLSMSTG